MQTLQRIVEGCVHMGGGAGGGGGCRSSHCPDTHEPNKKKAWAWRSQEMGSVTIAILRRRLVSRNNRFASVELFFFSENSTFRFDTGKQTKRRNRWNLEAPANTHEEEWRRR